ncbi:hypothetical protein [Neomegalonema sp.]|uniref:hypothetical protein n=1 Tax=Neomegalonema sp. TaxID=2039713 RepID=UPI002613619F|nr:hypothetical protein [Neomegalonema sp.]MDD2869681.1 hypothetical protein [Neomegalonema sp.]
MKKLLGIIGILIAIFAVLIWLDGSCQSQQNHDNKGSVHTALNDTSQVVDFERAVQLLDSAEATIHKQRLYIINLQNAYSKQVLGTKLLAHDLVKAETLEDFQEIVKRYNIKSIDKRLQEVTKKGK